ncbi:Rv2231c family pyridoxal phosphate-dependent protein CobC [Marinactinospora thermotolerans]|uniref:Aminotransferase n=1 Tax=Marinactinospora thermotolerans DSM 45154 TaxID=1122192 RepID=A0A1T4T8W2_9ACTN|nr:Rv2231c family pyridoxal phosphate-dependent protein CobC [Marinactinospora thermotolerans]SKA36793.1 L-threonine O-3-phosphate decarboxylase [Marinactinospora thermotolerans DSM 45154]
MRVEERSDRADGIGVDLRHHGDSEVGPDLLDFAVNVRAGTPPRWLAERLAASLEDLAAYPDPRPAREAVARRHGRAPDEVLLTAGAAEAFVLIARFARPRRAVVVHPQFTEPEAALRAAGHEVHRVLLPPDYTLDPALVPDDADLVIIGNPTNPTSVLHPARTLARLARPGRLLVVDEAFADCVPGEPESLSGRADLPGLIVVRSLTKTWGLAGLRVGYLLAEAALVRSLAETQPLWAVSTPALTAALECSSDRAVAEAREWARELGGERDRLAAELAGLGLRVTPNAAASFLLVRSPQADRLRTRLRAHGIAVRRGDTFPGLGTEYLRIAVRDRQTNERLTRTLAELL